MRVAVIGAGISGMACAIELERQGISPVVFDQKNRPGELLDHATATIRPYKSLDYMRKKLNIELDHIGKVRTIITNFSGKRTRISGRLGYFLLRGCDTSSVESQMYRKMRCGVVSNTSTDYRDLRRCFDYVVVAGGGFEPGKPGNVRHETHPTFLVGASVLGSFDMSELLVWLDTCCSKSAYAYLAPMEKARAFLGLTVPESNPDEALKRWRMLWSMEQLPYTQVNEVIFEYRSGLMYPHQVDNVLFTGITGDLPDPLLGFSLVSAIECGVMAARAIAAGRAYEDLVKGVREDMNHVMVRRDLFTRMDNRGCRMMLGALNRGWRVRSSAGEIIRQRKT